jgi:Calcineurin-like phosphoesterase
VREPTAPGLLVAFLGDQGLGRSSARVLSLVAAERADLVLHGGDFDYRDDPAGWDAQIDALLGPDFPYLSTVGNHDVPRWYGPGGYAERVARRVASQPELRCRGELGVTAECTFRGLRVLQSCVGVSELDAEHCAADAPAQLDFLASALDARTHLWTVCSWHKNQRHFQVGKKEDEVGYGAYRLCMEHGAIIATAHEHSYARTTTLTAIDEPLLDHGARPGPDRVELGPGSTFVFVSGLSGHSIRALEPSHRHEPWWAAYATRDAWLSHGAAQEGAADYGALFVRFAVDGEPDKARGYFKDVSGRVLDEFELRASP